MKQLFKLSFVALFLMMGVSSLSAQTNEVSTASTETTKCCSQDVCTPAICSVLEKLGLCAPATASASTSCLKKGETKVASYKQERTAEGSEVVSTEAKPACGTKATIAASCNPSACKKSGETKTEK